MRIDDPLNKQKMASVDQFYKELGTEVFGKDNGFSNPPRFDCSVLEKCLKLPEALSDRKLKLEAPQMPRVRLLVGLL